MNKPENFKFLAERAMQQTGHGNMKPTIEKELLQRLLATVEKPLEIV